MKQSERIRMYRSYHEHPLREQYEKEKKEVLREVSISPLRVFLTIVQLIPIVLFFVCGYFFFYSNDESSIGLSFIFGVINILAGVSIISSISEEKADLKKKDICNDSRLNELEDKYAEQGLYEVEDPCREPCGERDYDGDCVCSVTGNLLSCQEFAWCQVEGNCMHCSKFVTAFFGADALERWNYEIQK